MRASLSRPQKSKGEDNKGPKHERSLRLTAFYLSRALPPAECFSVAKFLKDLKAMAMFFLFSLQRQRIPGTSRVVISFSCVLITGNASQPDPDSDSESESKSEFESYS